MKYLIFLYFFSFYVEQFGLFTIGSYSLTFADFLTIGMLIVFIKDFVWSGKKIIVAKNPLYFFIALFFIVPSLSWIPIVLRGQTPEITQTLKSTIHFWFTGSIVFFICSYRMDLKFWNWTIRMFLLLSIVINGYAIYQLPARAFDLPFAYIQMTSASYSGKGTIEQDEMTQIVLKFESFYRATSFFSEPSALAGYNVLIFTFMVPPLLRKKKHFFKSKKLIYTIIALMLIGLMLAFSLTGVISLFAVIGFIMIYENRRLLITFSKFLVGVIILVFIVNEIVLTYTDTSILDLFSERVSSIAKGGKSGQGISGESYFTRKENALIGMRIWAENPIFGYGFGNFLYATTTGYMYADIAFISVIAELGSIGGIAFLMIFISLIYYGMMFSKRKIWFKNDDLTHFGDIINSNVINLIILNFVSGNQISSISFWMFITFLVVIINEYYIENDRYYEISFFEKPLRNRFLNAGLNQLTD